MYLKFEKNAHLNSGILQKLADEFCFETSDKLNIQQKTCEFSKKVKLMDTQFIKKQMNKNGIVIGKIILTNGLFIFSFLNSFQHKKFDSLLRVFSGEKFLLSYKLFQLFLSKLSLRPELALES